ncbi:MAG: class IIb bacteriocin, lactobin A/cerein 7B family [Dysgonomonas sp.]
MKNLQLKDLGVEEMSEMEMTDINGGVWGAIGAGVAVYLCISSIEHPNSFFQGLLMR